MVNKARADAIRLLATRELSVGEMQTKLKAKGYDFACINETLQALICENLLSDERFTEAFVTSRIERGSGPLRIRTELRQRTIDDTLIERFINLFGSDWVVRAKRARKKRFGELLPKTHKDRARQVRFLQSRGFTDDQIRAVLERELQDI